MFILFRPMRLNLISDNLHGTVYSVWPNDELATCLLTSFIPYVKLVQCVFSFCG